MFPKQPALIVLFVTAFFSACTEAPRSTTPRGPSAQSSAPESGPTSRQMALSFEIAVPEAPAGSKTLRLWIPTPPELPGQKVRSLELEARSANGEPLQLASRETREEQHDNRITFIECLAAQTPFTVTLSVDCERELITASQNNLAAVQERDLYLAPNRLVPINEEAVKRGRKAIGQRTGLAAVRGLFDATLGHMSYDKSKEGWGTGSFAFACDSATGNCTDFHAYFIAMARANAIAARFEIGIPFPDGPKSGQTGGYHCWAFAEVEGRWWPVDISEAWKHPERREQYFGRMLPDRVTLSTGRDIVLAPPQAGAPLNYFVAPYAEVDGQPFAVERTTHYSIEP